VSVTISTVIVIAAIGVLFAVRQSPGNPPPLLFPGQIYEVTPGAGDQLPNQGRVGVVVATNWTATISIDGIDIPVDQMTIRESLGEYYFDPGPGKVLENLRPGRVCVIATAQSQLDDTPAVSHSWCFTAI
jgi:hypothetical protein